jgi:hypothetical protein
LRSSQGDAERPEESIGAVFSPMSRRNQKLQSFEVGARLLQMGELHRFLTFGNPFPKIPETTSVDME